ncbi:MAG: Trm112 family protein [Mycobacterium sp.]
MTLDAALLDILVCPIDRGSLLLVGGENDGILYNPRLRKAYRIENSIPVLLPDEAREVTDEEHERFTRSAG